ncbi:MAG: hypothetical protein AVO38_02035 [delta proteobacterium ML8_D]|nr:MAG: hypothetical protein AVO38_02035 [delta proteobacterium ML8_D]
MFQAFLLLHGSLGVGPAVYKSPHSRESLFVAASPFFRFPVAPASFHDFHAIAVLECCTIIEAAGDDELNCLSFHLVQFERSDQLQLVELECQVGDTLTLCGPAFAIICSRNAFFLFRVLLSDFLLSVLLLRQDLHLLLLVLQTIWQPGYLFCIAMNIQYIFVSKENQSCFVYTSYFAFKALFFIFPLCFAFCDTFKYRSDPFINLTTLPRLFYSIDNFRL